MDLPYVLAPSLRLIIFGYLLPTEFSAVWAYTPNMVNGNFFVKHSGTVKTAVKDNVIDNDNGLGLVHDGVVLFVESNLDL
ncbi:MAG: hypothetical protein GY801_41105 [bacterium]|nr:hypothetical protein [bacterium]